MDPRAERGVCRCCMCTASQMQPLARQIMEGDSRTLLEVLNFVTDMTICNDDRLPQQVCAECLTTVRIADTFKRRCLASDEKFNHSLGLTDPIWPDLEQKNVCLDYEDKLKCIECNRSFENLPDMRAHIECHERLYQCSICLQRYANSQSLELHLSEHHCNVKKIVTKFECSCCEETFMNNEGYESHLKECNKFLTPIPEESLDGSSDHDTSSHTEKFKIEVDSVEINGVNTFNPNFPQKLKVEHEADQNTGVCINETLPERRFSRLKCDLDFEKKSSTQHSKLDHSDIKIPKTRSVIKNKNKINISDKNTGHGRQHIKLNQNRSRKRKFTKTEEQNIFNLELGDLEKGRKHLPSSLPSTNGTFKCTMCERKFNHKYSLHAHLKKHESMEKESHICSVCKREFKHRAHLNNHVLSVHSSDKGMKCDFCSKSFSSQTSLELHLVSHKDEKKHQCKFCEKGFNMISTLKDHLRTHTGEKPFLCSTCGRSFSQKTNLKEHMRRHAGYKPFTCDSCDQKFVTKGELVAHSRKHSGAHPFICEECQAGFTTSSSLVKHRRIHSGDRPYVCGVCPMRFTALGTLKNHRRTHTGEKPFKCVYCEKAFAQRNDLVAHTRCHTGERPYVCSACGQAFRQASAHKTHLKLHSNAVLAAAANATAAAVESAPVPADATTREKQLPSQLLVQGPHLLATLLNNQVLTSSCVSSSSDVITD